MLLFSKTHKKNTLAYLFFESICNTCCNYKQDKVVKDNGFLILYNMVVKQHSSVI